MIRIPAILLIVLTLGAGMKEVVIHAVFRINQDAIAAAFCINQEKPELKCQGKCFLQERLDAAKDAENTPVPLPEIEHTKNPVFFSQTTPVSLIPEARRSRTPLFQASLLPYFTSMRYFHPPEQLA